MRFESDIVRFAVNLSRIDTGTQHTRDVHCATARRWEEVLRVVEEAVEQQQHRVLIAVAVAPFGSM